MQLDRTAFFVRFLALTGLLLVVVAVPTATATPGPRTSVQDWQTRPHALRSGAAVTAPVRVLTDRRGVRRHVRTEVRREGGRWVVLPTRRSGAQGRAAARWTSSPRAEGTYWIRLRVLPRGSGKARVPGALTAPRRLTVVRAATHPETTPLLKAFNEARSQGRRCGREWYAAQPPLPAQADLRVAAQRHAEDMARHDYFSHTGRNGSSVEDRTRAAGYPHAAGENLAAGQESAEDAVEAWLESPGHCVNIMWPHYRTIGIGYSPRVDDSTYRSYWVTNLGTR